MHRCVLKIIMVSVFFIPFQIHTSFADDIELTITLPKLLREKPQPIQQSPVGDVFQADLSRSLLDVAPVTVSIPRNQSVTIGELIVDDVPTIQHEFTEKRTSFFSMMACCCNCCRK